MAFPRIALKLSGAAGCQGVRYASENLCGVQIRAKVIAVFCALGLNR